MIKTTLSPSATENPIIHSVNCFEDSSNPSVIRHIFSLSSKQNLLWLLMLVLPWVLACIFSFEFKQIANDEDYLTFIAILFIRSTQQTTSIKPVTCLVYTMLTACIPTVLSIWLVTFCYWCFMITYKFILQTGCLRQIFNK